MSTSLESAPESVIDPQAEPLLRAMTEGPPLNQLGVEGARAWGRKRHATPPEGDSRLSVRDHTVASNGYDVPIRVYRPADATGALPVVLFIHGGGWVMGDLDSADWACRRLALQAGCAVVGVAYRLSPENRYPVPLQDCQAALRWILDSAEQFDRSRVCVGGESSGGQLAATLCLAARDELATDIALQLLVCPALDARMQSGSWREFGAQFLPVAEQMSWMWDLYAGTPELRTNPRVSPAEEQDLTGLPPTIILTAEFDPLRDEAEEYGRRLDQAGVDTTVRRYAGQIHAMFGCAAAVDRCRDAIDEAAADIAEKFRSDPHTQRLL